MLAGIFGRPSKGGEQAGRRVGPGRFRLVRHFTIAGAQALPKAA